MSRCQELEDADFAAIDTGFPAWAEGEPELEKSGPIHLIVMFDKDDGSLVVG